MLLNDILSGGVEWTPQGIQCSTEAGTMKVFKFIREAVLDRHIYISKAVGARFTNDIHGKASTDGKIHIEGHYNCGESYPELMVHLNDKIYLVEPSMETLNFTCRPGVVNITDVMVASGVLYLDPYLLRVLTNVMTLEVTIRYGCGFSSMSKNSRIKSDMFPFYTDYSLAEYVRVLPTMPGEKFIKMKFLNGMTVDKFLNILKRWSKAVDARDVSKEELIWLQSFGH